MAMVSRNWTEPQVARGTTRAASFRRLRARAARWIVAVANQVYPAVVVLGSGAVLVAATITLRLAIWLPLHFHP